MCLPLSLQLQLCGYIVCVCVSLWADLHSVSVLLQLVVNLGQQDERLSLLEAVTVHTQHNETVRCFYRVCVLTREVVCWCQWGLSVIQVRPGQPDWWSFFSILHIQTPNPPSSEFLNSRQELCCRMMSFLTAGEETSFIIWALCFNMSKAPAWCTACF